MANQDGLGGESKKEHLGQRTPKEKHPSTCLASGQVPSRGTHPGQQVHKLLYSIGRGGSRFGMWFNFMEASNSESLRCGRYFMENMGLPESVTKLQLNPSQCPEPLLYNLCRCNQFLELSFHVLLLSRAASKQKHTNLM